MTAGNNSHVPEIIGILKELKEKGFLEDGEYHNAVRKFGWIKKKMKSVILSGEKSDFTTYFQPPIELGVGEEVALINLETYHSFPNIEKGKNDTFMYSNGVNWKTVK